MKTCKKCGNQLGDSAIFCTKCGEPAEDESTRYAQTQYRAGQNNQKQSTGTVMLIAVFSVIIVAAIATLCIVVSRNKEVDTQIITQDLGDQATKSPQSQTQKPKETPTPTVDSYPIFLNATASATTKETKASRDYSADLVLDGRSDTAWNFTGTSGQWVKIYSSDEQHVHGMRILNGYCKYSPDYKEWLYYKNNRPHNITVSFSNGITRSYSLDDSFDPSSPVYQNISFDDTIATTYIQITVDSVYKGNTWNDTAISEISVY